VRFLRGREKRQLDFQTAVRRRMLASVNDVQSHPTQAAKESPDPAANTPLFDAPADPDVAGWIRKIRRGLPRWERTPLGYGSSSARK
jgi:hypothetical protein